MQDSFVELTLPKNPTAVEAMRKPFLIALTVLLAAAGIFTSNFLFLIGAIVMAIADTFLLPKCNVEYEYSYINGEIDIAAIYSKSSRKELASVSLEDVECIAPLGSHELDAYGDTFKTVDYSVRDAANKPYVFVQGGEKKQKILVQLNDAMKADLKNRVPRKMHLD